MNLITTSILQVFSIPTSQFVSYQVTKTLPYWYHRYLLFNKHATIEPLYQIEGANNSGRGRIYLTELKTFLINLLESR